MMMMMILIVIMRIDINKSTPDFEDTFSSIIVQQYPKDSLF